MRTKARYFSGGVYDLTLHLVWCPKYRKPLLVGPVALRLEELIRQAAAERDWEITALEIMPDHVHLLVRPDTSVSPASIARVFKGGTSRVLRDEFPHLRKALPTLWSSSYFVASAGAASEETIRKYIDTQWARPWRKGEQPLPQGKAETALS